MQWYNKLCDNYVMEKVLDKAVQFVAHNSHSKFEETQYLVF